MFAREHGDARGDLETVKCSALLIVKLDVPLLERERHFLLAVLHKNDGKRRFSLIFGGRIGINHICRTIIVS